jgi:hypothetical protein
MCLSRIIKRDKKHEIRKFQNRLIMGAREKGFIFQCEMLELIMGALYNN